MSSDYVCFCYDDCDSVTMDDSKENYEIQNHCYIVVGMSNLIMNSRRSDVKAETETELHKYFGIMI